MFLKGLYEILPVFCHEPVFWKILQISSENNCDAAYFSEVVVACDLNRKKS